MAEVDIDLALAEINRIGHIDLGSPYRLHGGAQGGAWLVREREKGRKWVLKLGVSPHALSERSDLIDQARKAGWPTPEWLCSGVVSLDEAPCGYYIQRYVGSVRRAVSTDDDLSAIIAANEIQAELCCRRYPSLVRSGRAIGRATESALSELREAVPQTGHFASMGLQVISDLSNDVRNMVTRCDLSHGDYSLTNCLFRGGVLVAIVDCGDVHASTRLLDLAELLRQGVSYDWPPALLNNLIAYCDAHFDPRELLLCTGYVCARNLIWCVNHRPAEVLSRSAAFYRLLRRFAR